MYDGVVRVKEEALQQYTRAVSRGESAGIVRCIMDQCNVISGDWWSKFSAGPNDITVKL